MFEALGEILRGIMFEALGETSVGMFEALDEPHISIVTYIEEARFRNVVYEFPPTPCRGPLVTNLRHSRYDSLSW